MKSCCSLCKEIKDLIEFKKDKRRPDGFSSHCKSCSRISALKYYHKTKDVRKDKINSDRRKNHFKNREKENKNSKVYKEENKNSIKEYNKRYREENIDKIKFIHKEYSKNNREKVIEYNRNYINTRLKTDDVFKLTHYIRSSIRKSFKRNGFSKKSRTFQILGCSYIEFKLYLESKFELWMTWDNYGKYNGDFDYGWDIDHITPLSLAIIEDDVIRLNHYTNLQPLCSKINRDIKRDNFEIIH